MKDGSESTCAISTLRTLTFPGGNLLLTFSSGSTGSFPLADVRKVYFSAVTGISESLDQTPPSFSVFPNPASEVINLVNLSKGSHMLFIYRIDGKPVHEQFLSPGAQAVNIPFLPAGIYVVSTGGESAKFMKL